MKESEQAPRQGSVLGRNLGRNPSETRKRIFTDYVHSLDPRGEPPDLDSFQRLLRALRSALVSELKHRSLWEVPPSYLGVLGYESWESDPAQGGALDELTAAAYTFNFVARLRALRAQLRVKPNIDGLIIRNLRNFLHERQKKHDPLGFRIFEVLHSAVHQAMAAGTLRVVDGDPRVRNDTVLATVQDTSTPELSDPGGRSEKLRSLAAAWCGFLLPELITAQGRRRDAVLLALARRLGDLPREGLYEMRFGELVDTLKAEIRGRWAALFQQAAGESGDEGLGHIVQLCRPEPLPDAHLEAQQTFRQLAACVSEELKRRGMGERTRRYLGDLWEFLRLHAAGPEGAAPGSLSGALEKAVREPLPSRRQLAELLAIPRDRLPELYATLGEILRHCRATSRRPESVQPLPAGNTLSAPQEPGGALGDSYSRQLLAATRNAFEAAMAVEAERPTKEILEPGELVVFPASSGYGIEWLVLDRGSDGRWLLVPADTNPLTGSADVEVSEDHPVGPLVLRCRFGVWVAEGTFAESERTGVVDGEHVRAALDRWRQLQSGSLITDPLAREVDADPEYKDWVSEVLQPARRVLEVVGSLGAHPLRGSRVRPVWSPTRTAQALAASLLAAVVGLAGWVLSLDREVERLSQPSLLDVGQEILFGGGSRGEENVLEVSATAEHLLISVILGGGVASHGLYRLELLDETAATSWISATIAETAGGELRLMLPHRFWHPGRSYRIRLYAVGEAGSERLLEEQSVRFETRDTLPER